MIGFGESVKMFFTRAFDFEGRSTRAEYWWVILLYVLVIVGGMIPIFILAGVTDAFEGSSGVGGAIGGIIMLLMGLFFIVGIIPSISLAVRRFHDLNQTGWLVLVFFIIGLFLPVGIVQWIWFCFPGTPGPNNYGENPYENFYEIFE